MRVGITWGAVDAVDGQFIKQAIRGRKIDLK